MTVEEVLALVNNVRDEVDDSEQAHLNEDALYVAVLEAIAAGAPNAAALASAALQADSISYERWYA